MGEHGFLGLSPEEEECVDQFIVEHLCGHKIEVRLGTLEALLIVCAVQLALRHPVYQGASWAPILAEGARALERGLALDCQHPVARILAAGRDPLLDVPLPAKKGVRH